MKKVVSLMLVLVLALGMATMASAAPAYDKYAKGGSLASYTHLSAPNGDAGTANSDGDTDEVKIQGGKREYWVELRLETGKREAGTVTATDGVLTDGAKSQSKVTVKTVVKKGAKALDEIKLDKIPGRGTGKTAEVGLLLKLKDELVTNNSDGVEFDFRAYLIVDGKHWNSTNETITWTGTLKNNTIEDEIDEDFEYVYMGEGDIIKAASYIKSIEMDLGEGVSVFGKMFKDKKYYAKASMDSYNDAEDEFMDANDIDTVYHIKEAGVKAVASYVKLNDEDSGVFVYGRNGSDTPVYLGKGDSKLDFYETYYLSDKEIDFGGEDEEPVDEDPTDPAEVPGDLGGDDYYPENVNDNPGTGC